MASAHFKTIHNGKNILYAPRNMKIASAEQFLVPENGGRLAGQLASRASAFYQENICHLHLLLQYIALLVRHRNRNGEIEV